jgi:tRNA G18 (ribose-2'-O)-methylase SpoU
MRKLDPPEIPRPDAAALASAPRNPVRIVLENVRSAFNVGSILRTSDALRIDHVYLCGYTPDGSHPGVHKAALGAQDTVPWSRWPGVEEALRDARSSGYSVAALEITDTPTPVRKLEVRHFPLCLVLGNEVDGVSDLALGLCDLAIELPQFGAKHSLNVAVAFGVAGYDLVRRYRELTGSV